MLHACGRRCANTPSREDLVVRAKEGKRYEWLFGAFGFYRHGTMHAPVVFKRAGIEELIIANANQYLGPVWNEGHTPPASSGFRSARTSATRSGAAPATHGQTSASEAGGSPSGSASTSVAQRSNTAAAWRKDYT